MNRDERFIALWNDYLEGQIDEPGMQQLQALFAQDDRLLQTAADSYRIHRLLGLISQDIGARREDFVRETLARLPIDGDRFVDTVMKHLPHDAPCHGTKIRQFFSTWSGAAAVAAAIVLIAVVFWWQRAEPEIVRITEVNGTAWWTGAGGRVVSALEAGRSLRGGTLELLSADSWADLLFRDGSTVTISGPSMLTISEQRQKALYLRSGSLSANVRPQPADKPMLVHTPTSRMKVLGTQLDVEAELSTTVLTVNAGRVRMTRLIDGSVADVPAHHQVVASADRSIELKVTRRPDPVTTWQGELPADRLYGRWLPGSDGGDGRLRTAPLLLGPPEEPATLHMVLLSVSRDRPNPVVLTRDATFHVRGWIARPGTVFFGFTAKHSRGGFAGKFLIERRFEVMAEQGEAMEIQLRLDTFAPQERELTEKYPEGFPASPIGLELFDWWCGTVHEDIGLEIAHVMLDAGAPATD